MKLSPDHIKEFQAIYKSEHGVELTIEQATERAYMVMSLYLCLQHKLSQAPSPTNQNHHE